jgi:hypothetical protein
MWLPSWQRAAAKIGATPKLQHSTVSSTSQSPSGTKPHMADKSARLLSLGKKTLARAVGCCMEQEYAQAKEGANGLRSYEEFEAQGED